VLLRTEVQHKFGRQKANRISSPNVSAVVASKVWSGHDMASKYTLGMELSGHDRVAGVPFF
jgi:hypothetical protein